MKRSQQRECAFILCFERCFNGDLTIEEIAETAKSAELFEAPTWAVKLAETVTLNEEKIDEMIAENLKNWTISRISKVNLSILRLAIGEIMYFDDVPDSVTANEAVEIAKKYSDDKGAKFVNAVIGSVIKKKNEAADEKNAADENTNAGTDENQ